MEGKGENGACAGEGDGSCGASDSGREEAQCCGKGCEHLWGKVGTEIRRKKGVNP
jgi:hypothetical protein